MAAAQERRNFQLLSVSGIALALGILAAGNYLLSVIPLRLDTSSGHAYSISPASKAVLAKLEDRLLVRVVFSRDLPPVYKLNQRYVTDILTEYRRASGGKVRIEFADPSASSKARETALGWGIVPVQLDVMERDRREVAEKFMGVAFSYGDKTEAIPFVQDVRGLEYEITVRIRKLIDPTKPVIALLQNGGALTGESQSLGGLAEPLRSIYDVRMGDAADPIPNDVRAVLWVGPTQPSSPTVHANLNAYLGRGGSVGLLVDQGDVDVAQFRVKPIDNGLDPFLAGLGMTVDRGFIVDPQCDRIQIRAMQGSFQMINVVDFAYFPLISSINRSHPAARGIDSFTAPFCSPVRVLSAVPGLEYIPIARTSPASFLDRSPVFVSPMNSPRREDGAPAGPFNVAMLAQGTFPGGSKPGRLVVFGTSRIARSEYPARPSNVALVLNFIDWLAQDDSLVQIRSKGDPRRPLRELPDAVRLLLKYAMVLFLPFVSLAWGALVWRRMATRRKWLALEYGDAK